MSAQGGTIGSRLAARLEGDRDRYVAAGPDGAFMGECRAHDVRKKVTAQQLEAWAEAEYEAMTYDGWQKTICPTCNQARSDSWACGCFDGDYDLTPAEKLLFQIHGTLPERITGKPPADAWKPCNRPHGPMTRHAVVLAEIRAYCDRTGADYDRVCATRHLWNGVLGL